MRSRAFERETGISCRPSLRCCHVRDLNTSRYTFNSVADGTYLGSRWKLRRPQILMVHAAISHQKNNARVPGVVTYCLLKLFL